MTIKLIGTCYSHHWDGTRSFRAIIGVEDGYRLTKRHLESEREATCYGKRLFYRLARTGGWEVVPSVKYQAPSMEGL